MYSIKQQHTICTKCLIVFSLMVIMNERVKDNKHFCKLCMEHLLYITSYKHCDGMNVSVYIQQI